MTDQRWSKVADHPGLVLAAFVGLWLGAAMCSDRRMCIQFPSSGSKVRSDLVTIRSALDEYAMNNEGVYPSTLGVLVIPDGRGHRYLDQVRLPRDPWGREYVYVPGETVNILTYGRDGIRGGQGDDADIDYFSIVEVR